MSKDENGIRLNKYLAMSGIASRRKCDDIIKSGVVKINGRPINDLATLVHENDKVFVQGKMVYIKEKRAYIVLNKPNDYITTAKDEKDRKTVLDLVKVKDRIFPVGRLDRKTTGVLLLTNDGDLANRLMHPKYQIEKEYRVNLDKPIKRNGLHKLLTGVTLEDGIAKASAIFKGATENEVYVIVHEGRNHLVRRMFEELGFNVVRLERVRYANITTKGLRRGEWRSLKSSEVLDLKEMVKMV